MSGLARACHPGPTLVVTAIAVLLGLGFDLDPGQLVLVGLTVLVGQLSIGWSNDWLDAGRDAASGRKDKPAASGDVSAASLRTASLVGVVAVVPLSVLPGWRPGACHLLLVGSGWMYNVGLKRTVASPLPYLVGFGAFPAYVSLVADIRPAWWLVFAGGLLGVSAHFANAATDVEADRRVGVYGAPQRVGARASLLVSLCLLAAAGLLSVGQLQRGAVLATGAVLVLPAVGLALVARGKVRPVFPLVMACAVVDVAVLVVAA